MEPAMERPAFIDTSLDTHIVLTFSDTDTVSDLKEKLLVEHPISFPEFGEIEITAFKQERKGKYYHLADSVRMINTLQGLTSGVFFHVDASSLLDKPDVSPRGVHMVPENEVLAGGATKDTMQHDVTQVSGHNSLATKKRKADDPVKLVAERNIPCSSDVGTRGPIASDMGTILCSQVPSHVIQNIEAGQPVESRGTADCRNSVDEGNNHKEVSIESNGVNSKDLGEDVKKTQSLLATSSATFKDGSSKSSSFDDQAGVDSDACTRSLSDEENDESLEVSDSSEGEEDGQSSQKFSPDSVFRSSSRYEMFNPTASQLHPEE